MSNMAFDTEQLRDSIVQALVIELKTSAERVLCARSLKNELGLDSIAAANVTFALEDEYSVDIEIEDGDAIDSVDDLVKLLRKALREDVLRA